jgi:dipeptidyl aminopeptidase/acylaminoacyl peptidase
MDMRAIPGASRRFCLLAVLFGSCATAPEPTSPPGTLTGAAPAAAPATMSPPAGLPPLIERELFFDDPEIAGEQISPDGRFISFRKPYRGVVNIWVKRREEPFSAARPLTADAKRPVRAYFWTEDGRRILYAQDKGGDENFRIYAVDPAGKPEAESGVPPARDLTPYPGVRAIILAVPERTPGSFMVGLNDRDPQVHDVYRVEMATGKRSLLFQNDQNVAGWDFDLQGRLRLGVRQTADGGTELLRVDGKKLVSVYTCTAEESCYPIRFHKDGRRVYLTSNRGAADLARLVLFDPKTGKEEVVEEDPEKQVDLAGPQFSDATEELVATYYQGDLLRAYPKDPKFKRDYELLRHAFPEGDLVFRSATENDRLQIWMVSSDVDPGSVHLYDRQSGKIELLYRRRPDLPNEHLAPMKSVRYQARDGLEIPAYLTIPKGVVPRNLPVVLNPHGGPWGRDIWRYNAYPQFLANRGYAVLQPNFRGSAGYGKKFLNLGNKQWGTGTMQHDLSDGVKWLIEQGIADPKRVAIAGGSYGGYATLAGLAFTPDLYAAGVDEVGPSSIITVLNSIPPYWVPMKKMWTVRVGDVDNPADVERLKRQSPLYSVQAIKSPLLVIHGANDPRVKQAESDQLVVALRENKLPVEYLVAPDEGHGFAGKQNRLAMFAATERFLARHIGGRHQEQMAQPTAERLATLTVDVNKVVLKPAAPAKASGLAKQPTVSGEALRPATSKTPAKNR